MFWAQPPRNPSPVRCDSSPELLPHVAAPPFLDRRPTSPPRSSFRFAASGEQQRPHRLDHASSTAISRRYPDPSDRPPLFPSPLRGVTAPATMPSPRRPRAQRQNRVRQLWRAPAANVHRGGRADTRNARRAEFPARFPLPNLCRPPPLLIRAQPGRPDSTRTRATGRRPNSTTGARPKETGSGRRFRRPDPAIPATAPGDQVRVLTSIAAWTAVSRAPSIHACLRETWSPAKNTGPSGVGIEGCSSVSCRGVNTAASPPA
ncbi:hypothetical protein LX15_000041 [Streptoalloteichus tenebrarius]|uniref:Uncharacterized protein n=1 Tax=Streptoalloteichus tenebrarius (strain ATCC 17920 / DSM 40477 / JCM 4838 / CBS 697.72 / NBRC 16177 / NCIMB 11028 / NRRL B-12390 / A12253. 1 / ISP 5477) TaxID=1933 RepID=A0ABT1HLH2_STRSD|nr:hypothetical protein [Streptoalloteichus tenebrarius]